MMAITHSNSINENPPIRRDFTEGLDRDTRDASRGRRHGTNRNHAGGPGRFRHSVIHSRPARLEYERGTQSLSSSK